MNKVDYNLKYLIADCECLSDYFSLQLKNENSTVHTIECFNDEDVYKLYSVLEKITRPMYFYMIDYDKAILNALCKLVEKNNTDILKKLRSVNDYIIQQKVNYFRLNREFWSNHFFPLKEQNPDVLSKIIIQKAIEAFGGEVANYNFLNEHFDVLGQSKIIKDNLLNSIPKINYYISIRKDKSLVPTISLKNLQLLNEGYSVKFDLNKYTSIKQIKEDNLYDEFIHYGKNDVLSLEKEFLKKPKSDIMKRLQAIEAVLTINPDFQYNNDMIYSENNTSLINEVLKLNPDDINKDFNIDYTKYIHTDYDKFNKFVEFVNDNQDMKTDVELKDCYCTYNNKEYEYDDQQILEGGHVDLIVHNFDEIHIENQYNDIKVKFGLGGLHGAIEKYKGENLIIKDYRSQYPSIILQYKELFKNVINIELYEAIYNKRLAAKLELEELEAANQKIYDFIEKGGNDGADIAEYSPIIDENEKKIKKLKVIADGLKLILNSSFGLINSNFNIPIACKKLGRFITLKGQSLLLGLCYKYYKHAQLININTDGIILNQIAELPVVKKDRYFVLSDENIDSLIQNDVNNYLAVMGKKIKKKGCFNLKIKQWLNKNEKLSINMHNAMNLILNKPIEVKPICFGGKALQKYNKQWYLTSEKEGNIIIKELVKPEILSLNGEKLYFTDDPTKADFEIYAKHANTVKEQILNFKLNDKSNVIQYRAEILEDDTIFNIKEKRKIKRKLGTIFNSKTIGLVGYHGYNKKNSYFNNAPIRKLVTYTMTDILKSLDCSGFSVENNKHDQYLIFDIDLYDKNTGSIKSGWKKVKPFLTFLKKYDTFQCWNLKTNKYNRKFIFKNDEKFFKNIWNSKYKPTYGWYIELLDKATIYTIDGMGDLKYDCNWNEVITFDSDEFLKI